ncbi:dipeptide ABC transporter ATP-binding protein [Prosthecodimorpha staleyi]|uniref:ABC transporter ATP-binding protein n=1 Tax=Prosthecodimorpha staleyi TaxID=2840188 RepID=A0A947DAE3_9HYPH|nr:ABC transporter ATP-binding protein [Prosthecodimorpha staleyi]MBT9291537.1 ABC transporter ATP-binding protein [Prosthecodimorpha staleyi]
MTSSSLPVREPAAPLLDVRDLSTDVLTIAGPRRILDRVSFSVASGEVLALVGESGSGKSMAMQAIMGLIAPPALVAEGTIAFEGRDLLACSQRAMRAIRGSRIGMVFQEPMSALNPLLAVGDQIAETLVAHRGLGWAAARAESVRLLDLARVADARRVAGLRPHHLSGGMRQRVVIAAAIACKPALLIADEPTTALDATVQAEIMLLLGQLRREVGCAILLISHDMGLVASFAERAAVMLRGRIVESGPTAALMANPQSPYTRTLIAAGLPAAPATARRAIPAPDPATPAALEVRDLTVTFPVGGKRVPWGRSQHLFAVDGVGLSLAQGETLAVVGESGSGKTTLARAILGLTPIADGGVWIAGADLRDRPAEARSRIQYVFQDPQASLDPQFRAWRSVVEPLVLQGETRRDVLRRKAEALLVEVGLDASHLDRLPHELSGGQRQRLGIARALATRPRILIADEAVSALDATTRLQVLQLFQDLQAAQGLSYLFITHDLAVVARIAHRVAVMRFGRIVEIGPVDRVLADPQHPYTRALVASGAGRTAETVPVPGTARHRTGPAGYTMAWRYRTCGEGHRVLET